MTPRRSVSIRALITEELMRKIRERAAEENRSVTSYLER
jgi:hypothetical protein